MAVQPYTISVSDDVLEDLRHRLNHVRWPDEIPGGEKKASSGGKERSGSVNR